MALFLSLAVAAASAYTIDDTPCAASPSSCRSLDGVGGLSGGGATSVFLPYYPPQQREEILDFLFKPNFGAALQILKVLVLCSLGLAIFPPLFSYVMTLCTRPSMFFLAVNSLPCPAQPYYLLLLT